VGESIIYSRKRKREKVMDKELETILGKYAVNKEDVLVVLERFRAQFAYGDLETNALNKIVCCALLEYFNK